MIRRRVLVLYATLAALVVVLAGCASAPTDQSAAPAADPTVETTPTPTAEPDVAQSAPAVAPEAGRVALAAAEETPHVLWFWGAH